MTPAYCEAEVYFENLWQRERLKWLAGEVTPAVMENGATVPVDYCVTTVARLVEQPLAPVAAVETLITRLKALDTPHFIYPTNSIHISLLGCTTRAASKEFFDRERIDRIYAVCREVLKNHSAVPMSLKGVGIIGNQVFIQVFPHDRRWAEIRRELEEALLEHGETPIAYPNKAPIHMNILRVTSGDKAGLARLFETVEQLRAVELGDFKVALVDYLITDFVLSPANVTSLGRIAL